MTTGRPRTPTPNPRRLRDRALLPAPGDRAAPRRPMQTQRGPTPWRRCDRSRMGCRGQRHVRSPGDAARRMRRACRQMVALPADADSAGCRVARDRSNHRPGAGRDARQADPVVLVRVLYRRVRKLLSDSGRARQPCAARVAHRRRRPGGCPSLRLGSRAMADDHPAPAGYLPSDHRPDAQPGTSGFSYCRAR